MQYTLDVSVTTHYAAPSIFGPMTDGDIPFLERILCVRLALEKLACL